MQMLRVINILQQLWRKKFIWRICISTTFWYFSFDRDNHIFLKEENVQLKVFFAYTRFEDFSLMQKKVQLFTFKCQPDNYNYVSPYIPKTI